MRTLTILVRYNEKTRNSKIYRPLPGGKSQGQASVLVFKHTPEEQSPASQSPSICPSSSTISHRGLFPPQKTPRLSHPICGLTRSIPRVGLCQYNLPFPLSPLQGAPVLTQSLPFPSYLITCFFPTVWLYRSPFASFQLGFSENCSTCGCIFDTFVRVQMNFMASYSSILI